MLQIKEANANDIPLIRALSMQVWPQTYTPIIGETQVNYMLNRFYAPASLMAQMESGDKFVVCYSGETPVAFASYGKTSIDTYKLHKLYILPGMQGTGIGTFVLGHIKDAVRRAGAKQLQLNVNRYNYQAKKFYEKVGFSIIRDEDIDIGDGYYMNDHVLQIVMD